MKACVWPALGLLLTACASSDIKPIEYYRLHGAKHSLPAKLEVTVAEYLKRPGLMVAKGEHGLRAASGHRWAEPLALGVARSISRPSQGVAKQAAPEAPKLQLHIEQLHGSLGGEVALIASWQLHCGPKRGQYKHSYQEQRQQAAPGYKALVEAQQQLLQSLAEQLRQSLARCGGG